MWLKKSEINRSAAETSLPTTDVGAIRQFQQIPKMTDSGMLKHSVMSYLLCSQLPRRSSTVVKMSDTDASLWPLYILYPQSICLHGDRCAAPTPERRDSVYIFVKASELDARSVSSEMAKLKAAAQMGTVMNL